MKMLFAAAILISSFSSAAHAGTSFVPCEFQDYQKIDNALQEDDIREGAEFSSDLKALLTQEMGPSCNLVQYDELIIGIPGDRVEEYQIVSGSTGYSVFLVNSIESGGKYVRIVEMPRAY